VFLDVPFDSLATAVGDLSFGINYNSQENVDYGHTGGWSLDIGPSTSRRDIPLELVKLQPFPDTGVKIRLKGNRLTYFPRAVDPQSWHRQTSSNLLSAHE
jgi:hypothetical protein